MQGLRIFRQRSHKYISLFFFVFLLGTVIYSCGEEDLVETDAELIPYFEIFAAEAALRGITVDYQAERIEGLIQDIGDPNIQGQCFQNEKKPKKTIIDLQYWNRSTELEKQFIIFHELGHCFLEREHLDTDKNGTCISIMHSNPNACNFMLTEDNREDYLDELFSR